MSLAVIGAVLALTHVAAVLFSAIFGRIAERTGAAIYGASLALTWLVQDLLGTEIRLFMLIDLSTSVAFGCLATRYPSKLWPGTAACAQFLVFIFSATRAINYPLAETAYLIALNLAGLGLLASLVVGTWRARWGVPRTDEWEEFAATFASLPPTQTEAKLT